MMNGSVPRRAGLSEAAFEGVSFCRDHVIRYFSILLGLFCSGWLYTIIQPLQATDAV